MIEEKQPIPGFVYRIRIADDPREYLAMCLRVRHPEDMLRPAWFVNEYGNQGTRVVAARYVTVVGVDEDHARALWAALWDAFVSCGMFA